MENPFLVSVIIPNYNYARYIGKCIDSVLSSAFDHAAMEIIFIDDASTDQSVKVFLDHMAGSNVSFQLIQNDTNQGCIRSRNRGIVNAHGEYLFMLDADNFIHEDCLRKHLEALQARPDYCAAYAPLQEFVSDTAELAGLRSNASFDYQKLLGGNYIDAMALFRKSEILEVGMYDTSVPSGGLEDYELWLRLGKLGKLVYFIEGESLSSYRIHGRSMTAGIAEDVRIMLLIHLKRKYDIRVLNRSKERLLALVEAFSNFNAQLYYIEHPFSGHPRDDSSGDNDHFVEKHSLYLWFSLKDKNLSFKFEAPVNVSRLRFDPVHERIQIRVLAFRFYLGGRSLDTPYTLTSNAYKRDDQVFLFDSNDPQIVVHLAGQQAVLMDEVRVEFECMRFGEELLSSVLEKKKETQASLEGRNQILSEALLESRDQYEKLCLKHEQCQQELDNLKSKPQESLRESIGRYLRKQRHLEGILNLRQQFLLHWKLSIIRKSGLFDAKSYLQNNPDVRDSGMNPLDHYLQFGWRERRSPGALFDASFYLELYPDVKESGMNPLWHYLKHGKTEGRLPRLDAVAGNNNSAGADITSFDNSAPVKRSLRIAIICHMYYEDMVLDMIASFKNMPLGFDLFLTTTYALAYSLGQRVKEALPNVISHVIPVENRGRDMAPFFLLLNSKLRDYDLVCKVHTKKSSHESHLQDWGYSLIHNLLGSPAIINRIINEFEEYPGLGLLWPYPHSYLRSLGIGFGWGGEVWGSVNQAKAMHVFPDLKLDEIEPNFEFPSGSMFWYRPQALSYFFDHVIENRDFEEENGQLDGTLAHALERVLGLVSRKQGYFNRTVDFPSISMPDVREEKHVQLDQPKRIVFIAHDLQQAGAQIVLLHCVNWLHTHTAIDIGVIALRRGNNSDRLYHEYAKVSRLFVWNELVIEHGEEEAVRMLQKQLGVVDLIFGNTIISAEIYHPLSLFQAPYITFIHELEESIRKYSSEHLREALKQHTQMFIACSAPVLENLRQNHGIPEAKLELIHEFIKPNTVLPHDVDAYKRLLHLPADKVIIWGCGTINHRKGTDLFVETASVLKTKGIDNFVFCWIGANYWDADAAEYGPWKRWEDLIQYHQLADTVYFLGEKPNPREYMKAGDIYFLSSREDPYPLVGLEASECALPIVCFEGTGGMTAFVEEDAGAIIPFMSVHLAAEAMEEWILDADLRKEKGRNARKKLLQRHTDDVTMPLILNVCHDVMKSKPLVSVIVPVYNHEAYLQQRLNSILNQTFRDVEIIVLDDASTDSSFQMAQQYATHPFLRIHRNETNMGSPFHQWKKGLEMAKGDFVWIAEGDDDCEPDFLETLLQRLIDDNSVMAYCQSSILNGQGQTVKAHMRSHTDDLDEERWKKDYVETGQREVINFLFFRNTIPNGSACLFRRDSLLNASKGLDSYTHSGDWYLYAALLRQGSVSYVAKSLNHFRRHESSASLQLKSLEYLDEVLKVREFIAAHYPIHPDQVPLMMDYLDKDFKIEGIERNTAHPEISRRIEAMLKGLRKG